MGVPYISSVQLSVDEEVVMSNADLNKQYNYLRYALSQDKKPIAFLLSAGCSQAIKTEEGKTLIPGIEELTAVIIQALEEKEKKDIKNIVAELKTDGIDKPNIELILNHIRALIQVVGSSEFKGFNKKKLKELDKMVCDKIADIMTKDLPVNTPHHAFALWIGAISRDYPVEIFTTNYDLLIEQALENKNIPYFDGFVGSHKAFFDLHAMEEEKLPNRWVRLWKMHGSINWIFDENEKVIRSYPDSRKCKVIHPSHLKYDESRKMPYLAMADRLKHFLRQKSAVLLISGYSFRDVHINSNILDCLQSNPSGMAYAFLFDEKEKYIECLELSKKLKNFNILSKKGGVIGGKEFNWGTEPIASGDSQDQNVDFELGDFNKFGKFLSEISGEDKDEK